MSNTLLTIQDFDTDILNVSLLQRGWHLPPLHPPWLEVEPFLVLSTATIRSCIYLFLNTI